MIMRIVVPSQIQKRNILASVASLVYYPFHLAISSCKYQATTTRKYTMKVTTSFSPISTLKAKKSNIFKRQQFLSTKVLIAVFASVYPSVHSLFIPLLPSHLNTSFIHTVSCTSNNPQTIRSTTPTATPHLSSNLLKMSLRAWTCHGRSQRDMVEKLTSAGIIKSAPVKEALLRVDRSNYVENPSNAYMDAPQLIGHEQTISAPHMHSHALEEIVPTLTKISSSLEQAQKMEVSGGGSSTTTPAELKILDVGCGSGYLTAAFGRIVDRGSQGPVPPLKKGRVWGIDVIPDLVSMSRRNIMKADSDLLDSGTVTLSVGDGWKGLPNEGPFHAIHVGAAADDFPVDLLMQLYPDGGVMVIPVGPVNGIQNLYRVERLRESDEFRREDFHFHNLLGVRYVPLVQSKRP